MAPVGALVWLIASASPASARPSDEGDLVARIRQTRAAKKIRTLSVRSALVRLAEKHSAEMAARGAIFHTASLATSVDGWSYLGENVAAGVSIDEIHQAFMRSPLHRSNILEPRYDVVGVGVVRAKGVVYVTEIFVGASPVKARIVLPQRSSHRAPLARSEAVRAVAAPVRAKRALPTATPEKHPTHSGRVPVAATPVSAQASSIRFAGGSAQTRFGWLQIHLLFAWIPLRRRTRRALKVRNFPAGPPSFAPAAGMHQRGPPFGRMVLPKSGGVAMAPPLAFFLDNSTKVSIDLP